MSSSDKGSQLGHRSMRVGRFYEREAEHYDEVRWSSPGGIWTDKVQKQIIRSMLGNPNDGHVLELAVGTGRIGIDLAQGGWHIVGIDIALNMLRRAQQRAINGEAMPNLHFIQGSALQLPVKSESFDLCICVNALSLMPEYKEVLKEIARALKPGGALICNFANLLSYYLPFGIVVNSRGRALARDVYSRWHTPLGLRRQFQHAGFKVSDVQGQVHLPGHLNVGLALPLVKALHQISRNSYLRYLCPSLFFKLIRL